jgi:hypothetical protein
VKGSGNWNWRVLHEEEPNLNRLLDVLVIEVHYVGAAVKLLHQHKKKGAFNVSTCGLFARMPGMRPTAGNPQGISA